VEKRNILRCSVLSRSHSNVKEVCAAQRRGTGVRQLMTGLATPQGNHYYSNNNIVIIQPLVVEDKVGRATAELIGWASPGKMVIYFSALAMLLIRYFCNRAGYTF